MIRREDLAKPMPGADWVTSDDASNAADAAGRVKRGNHVRIVGLGVLFEDWSRGLTHGTYRLTLTGAVAKNETAMEPRPALAGDLAADVGRLAVALGAPVHVHGPTTRVAARAGGIGVLIHEVRP